MAFSPFILASILSQGAAGYQTGRMQAQARQDVLNEQDRKAQQWQTGQDFAQQQETDRLSESAADRQQREAMQAAGFGQDEKMAGINYTNNSLLSDQGYEQSLGLQKNAGNIATSAAARDNAYDLQKIGLGQLSNEGAFQRDLGDVPSGPQQAHVLDARNWLLRATLGGGAPEEMQLAPGAVAPQSIPTQAQAAEIGHLRFADKLAAGQFRYGQTKDTADRQFDQQKFEENKRQFGLEYALKKRGLDMDFSKTQAEIAALRAKGANPATNTKYSGLATNYGAQAKAMEDQADRLEGKAAEWSTKAQGEGIKPDDDGNVKVPEGLQREYWRNRDLAQVKAKGLREQAADLRSKQDAMMRAIVGIAPTTTGGTAPAYVVPAPATSYGPWIKTGTGGVSWREIGGKK